MTHVTIPVSLDGVALTHVCGPVCDCPRALARTQTAIDQDRVERGAQPRALSERLRGMRDACPDPEWFDSVAYRAEQLEQPWGAGAGKTAAGAAAAAWAAQADAEDQQTPDERLNAMYVAVEATVSDLERADLLPVDHEYDVYPNVSECRVFAGNLRFTVDMTGTLDTPASKYVVTTSTEDDDEPGTERITNNLDDVRAWLLAWGAAAVYA